MPAIVVILPTSTYRASDFIEAADALGVDLIVASEEPAPFDIGDRYIQIDCADAETAAEAIARLGDEIAIDGVVAADDQGVMVAAHASALLGLSGNDPGAAQATRDKLLMRNLLSGSEVGQPRFASVGPDTDPATVIDQVGLPLVLKPLDRSASQGVIRVDHERDFASTAARIRGIVGTDAPLLAESFVDGPEIAIEGIIRDGDLVVLAVFDKPDTTSGPYFPETIFVTPSRLPADALAEAERTASRAVLGLGLSSGPVHIELKMAAERVVVIEVAARSIGGLCSRSLDFGLMGTSLETLILRNAMGLDKPGLRRQDRASGVLMIPTTESGTLLRIEGEDDVRALDGITGVDFTTRPGNAVVAPPEGDRYLGFVYARGASADGVESALRKAMTTLEVQLEG